MCNQRVICRKCRTCRDRSHCRKQRSSRSACSSNEPPTLYGIRVYHFQLLIGSMRAILSQHPSQPQSRNERLRKKNNRPIAHRTRYLQERFWEVIKCRRAIIGQPSFAIQAGLYHTRRQKPYEAHPQNHNHSSWLYQQSAAMNTSTGISPAQS